jgi:hypothetical protein
LSGIDTNSGGKAIDATFKDYNSGGGTVIHDTIMVPTTYQNYISNYQSDFTHLPASELSGQPADFYSGSGTFTYTYGTPNSGTNNGCNSYQTAETSNLILQSNLDCGEFSRTQNFNAPTGYESHNSPPTESFTVSFGNPVVVGQDLLVASEATYAHSSGFATPTDTQGNTWTLDIYLSSAYDSLAIWHTLAKSSGPDTVTFSTTQTSDFTYAFVREFTGYSGAEQSVNFDQGASGQPHVPSFTPDSGALVFDLVAANGGGWSSSSGFTMIGGNTGWYTAAEFAPAWSGGSTTASWSSYPSAGDWSEIVVSYTP